MTKSLDLGIPTLGLGPRSLGLGPKVEPHKPVDPVVETVAVLEKYQSAFQQRAKTEEARLTQATDTEYWVCFCFETREQKDEFLRKSELLELGDKHIDGLAAAEILGVELDTPRVVWPRTRSTTSLVDLAVKKTP
jgi:hypothetical protein